MVWVREHSLQQAREREVPSRPLHPPLPRLLSTQFQVYGIAQPKFFLTLSDADKPSLRLRFLSASCFESTTIAFSCCSLIFRAASCRFSKTASSARAFLRAAWTRASASAWATCHCHQRHRRHAICDGRLVKNVSVELRVSRHIPIKQFQRFPSPI